VNGIDELRSFNHFNKITIPIYGNKMTLAALKNNFGYIFNGTVQIGGGIPQLEPRTLVAGSTFELGGVTITPLEIIHGKLEISGYKLNNVAYITDCSYLPENTLDLLKNLDLLILNSLGFKPHPTHFCLSEALEAIKIIQPKRTILTHINHYYDFEKVSRDLPENVELAYDGMSLDLAQ
jgi:phosphoribosyl 1,2-cyclic phosphate phosphodiesterase